LQRYSLDQLKVVGIIAGGNVRKALLEDDVGKGYVVAVGDAVGSEGGEITAIEKDRIIIESTYRDVLGKKKVRRITKKLYIAEEGENP
jgi:Tfp pilus assembly protein PilP